MIVNVSTTSAVAASWLPKFHEFLHRKRVNRPKNRGLSPIIPERNVFHVGFNAFCIDSSVPDQCPLLARNRRGNFPQERTSMPSARGPRTGLPLCTDGVIVILTREGTNMKMAAKNCIEYTCDLGG